MPPKVRNPQALRQSFALSRQDISFDTDTDEMRVSDHDVDEAELLKELALGQSQNLKYQNKLKAEDHESAEDHALLAIAHFDQVIELLASENIALSEPQRVELIRANLSRLALKLRYQRVDTQTFSQDFEQLFTLQLTPSLADQELQKERVAFITLLDFKTLPGLTAADKDQLQELRTRYLIFKTSAQEAEKFNQGFQQRAFMARALKIYSSNRAALAIALRPSDEEAHDHALLALEQLDSLNQKLDQAISLEASNPKNLSFLKMLRLKNYVSQTEIFEKFLLVSAKEFYERIEEITRVAGNLDLDGLYLIATVPRLLQRYPNLAAVEAHYDQQSKVLHQEDLETAASGEVEPDSGSSLPKLRPSLFGRAYQQQQQQIKLLNGVIDEGLDGLADLLKPGKATPETIIPLVRTLQIIHYSLEFSKLIPTRPWLELTLSLFEKAASLGDPGAQNDLALRRKDRRARDLSKAQNNVRFRLTHDDPKPNNRAQRFALLDTAIAKSEQGKLQATPELNVYLKDFLVDYFSELVTTLIKFPKVQGPLVALVLRQLALAVSTQDSQPLPILPAQIESQALAAYLMERSAGLGDTKAKEWLTTSSPLRPQSPFHGSN